MLDVGIKIQLWGVAMMRKKIISVLFCLMATGVLTPSSQSPSISRKNTAWSKLRSAISTNSAFKKPAKNASTSIQPPTIYSVPTSPLQSFDEPDTTFDSSSSARTANQIGLSTFSSSIRPLTSPMMPPTSSSNELEAPTLSAPRLHKAKSARNLSNFSSDTGADATSIIRSPAPPKTTPFDNQLGTGVFAKQNLQIDSPVIYQSPSKRLNAFESHVNDVEKLRKLYAKTPDGQLKDQMKSTIDAKLAQVKEIYKKMGGNLVEPAPDTPPATDTANKKLKTKIKDFITAKASQVKKMYSKEASNTTPQPQPKTTSPTDTGSYRAALDRSKKKRFDNISKKLAKIDQKLTSHKSVITKAAPQKGVAKSMQAAANWAKGFFEKKLYKTFINEEVSSILGAYNLSDPKAQREAVEQLRDHLTTLKNLTDSSKNLSKSNKKQLNTLIAKYQTATEAEINDEQKSYNAIFKQLDTLAGQQASVFKRAIARISGCTSWPQFQAKRAFDSQMNHTNLDVLATGALKNILKQTDPKKRAKKVDEYFATLQKPATKEQEAQLKQLKDYIVNDLWTKTTNQTKLEEQVKLVKAWKQYDKANKLWETWNKYKTGQEPELPKTPGGASPSQDKIDKLQAKIDAAKELDPTLFAKKGLAERVRHLTVPLKNKWLRYAAITTAVVVTTAAIAAIVIASYGSALAVVLPVIADIGTVVILAHRTAKQADTATGGQLATLVKKGADAIIDVGTEAMEAEHSAKNKRTHAKANLLHDAITNDNGKLRLEDDGGETSRLRLTGSEAQLGIKDAPLDRKEKLLTNSVAGEEKAPVTKTLTAEQRKEEAARMLAAEIPPNDDPALDFLK